MSDEVPNADLKPARGGAANPHPRARTLGIKEEFFPMTTLGRLAKLADERAIPQFLEQFCAATGHNPVKVALDIRREQWDNTFSLLVCAFLAVIAGGTLFTASLTFPGAWSGGGAEGMYARGIESLSAVLAIASVTTFFVEFGKRWANRIGAKNSDKTRKAETFFWDLDKFAEWSGRSLCTPCLPEAELREMATLVLARQASTILRHRRDAEDEDKTPEDQMQSKILEGEAFGQFKSMLAVLTRLGIAGSDYKPYFKKGEQYLAAEEEGLRKTDEATRAVAQAYRERASN